MCTNIALVLILGEQKGSRALAEIPTQGAEIANTASTCVASLDGISSNVASETLASK